MTVGELYDLVRANVAEHGRSPVALVWSDECDQYLELRPEHLAIRTAHPMKGEGEL